MSDLVNMRDLIDQTIIVNVACGDDDDFPPGPPGGTPPGQSESKTEIVPVNTEVRAKDIPSSKPSKQGGFLNMFKKD